MFEIKIDSEFTVAIDPALAPESDARPPYNSAAADFKNVAK